jgi:hypothetical protein
MRTVSAFVALLPVALVVLLSSSASADEVTTSKEPIQVVGSFTFPNDPTHWETCVTFKNVTAQAVIAVQFSFTYVDAFDTTIQTNRGDHVGQFAPGVLIDSSNCWFVQIAPGSLSKIITVVQKVRYQDGTIWVNSDNPQAFTTVYMGFRGDHPDTIRCHDQNYGGGLIGMIKMNWDDPRTAEWPDCMAKKMRYISPNASPTPGAPSTP